MLHHETTGDIIFGFTEVWEFTKALPSKSSFEYGQDTGSNLLTGPIVSAVQKLWSSTRDKFSELTSDLRADVNAELQRAIRRSCLKATIFACQFTYEQIDEVMHSWEEKEQDYLNQRLNAANRYLKKIGYKLLPPSLQTHRDKDDLLLSKIADIQTSLQSEIEKTKSKNYILPYNAIDFQFDKLVTWNHTYLLTEQLEDICQQMLNQIINELTDRFGKIPNQLEYTIRVGWFKAREYHFWFDEVSREFEAEIRHNQAVSNIYQAKIITKIKTDIHKISLDTSTSAELLVKFEGILNDVLQRLKDLAKSQKSLEHITNVDAEEFIRETQSDFFSSEALKSRENKLVDKLQQEHQLCLIGDPGVGKTYLAKKIAYDNKDKYDVVWWIDADNAKVEEELIQLAREVFKDPDNPHYDLVDQWLNRDKIGPDGVINNLYTALKGRSWLIVFDNAMDAVSGSGSEDNNEQHLNQELEAIQAYQSAYLPEITDKSYLLLTSRNEDWGTIKKSIPTERIKTWSDEDVREYIQKNENAAYESIVVEDINQLKIFEGLPLAVSIAKKYILDSDDEGKYSFGHFYNKWKANEDYFLKYKSKYHEKDLKHESLFITVGLSYERLKPDEKHTIDLFSCFGPDDLPVKLIYNERTKDKLKLNWTTARSSLIQLRKHSLSRFYERENLYSMHQVVQGCIRSLQGDALPDNYKLALFLAADAFKAISEEKTVTEKSKEQNNLNRDLLIPHIDALAIALRSSNINLIRAMNENDHERIKAIEFFISVGQSQSNIGDIRSATEQFETAIRAAETPAKEVENQKKIDNLKAGAQRGLAKVLFLKGQGAEGIDRAEELAKAAASHFEKENQLDYIDCQNDVVGKIQQRKCLFEDCEATYLKLEETVNKYIAENTTEEVVFEHIVQKYVKGESDKIAEKRGSIWHNLGSLYWTWGRKDKKDYEKARCYFKKAIKFQNQMVTALEDAKKKNMDQGTVLDRLSKADNKVLFLNVSRMIYGAVLALLKEFDGEEGEWEQHNEALDFFKERTFEKRRYAYTAYYMLANSWDRKELGMGLPSDFQENELLIDVRAHDKTLAGNDEKYDLIKKIINLREGVLIETRKEPSDKIPDYKKLKEYYGELENQLEAMKYTYKLDGNYIVRYYDVDTCSVSAILDYAKFLSRKGELRTAKKVAKYGLDVIKDIEYPRIGELETLAKGN